MWRSVIIYNGEKIRTENEWFIVQKPEGKEVKIPLADLYCVLIDNPSIIVTMAVFVQCAKYGVHIIIADEKHLPISQVYPMNTNYHCFHVYKKQIEMLSDVRGEIWKRIIISKINNQARVLETNGCNHKVVQRMRELASEVVPHDYGNREAICAKMFFRNAYGSEFVRFEDDSINSALNYGYAIIRSCVAKSLVAHGFNCVIGIHHISETNEFNLADDFMEPLRPIVDEWVINNMEFIEEGLSKDVKKELVDLVNAEITFDNKTTKVRYAIDKMISSFVSLIETSDCNKLILPAMI